MLLMEGS